MQQVMVKVLVIVYLKIFMNYIFMVAALTEKFVKIIYHEEFHVCKLCVAMTALLEHAELHNRLSGTVSMFQCHALYSKTAADYRLDN